MDSYSIQRMVVFGWRGWGNAFDVKYYPVPGVITDINYSTFIVLPYYAR